MSGLPEFGGDDPAEILLRARPLKEARVPYWAPNDEPITLDEAADLYPQYSARALLELAHERKLTHENIGGTILVTRGYMEALCATALGTIYFVGFAKYIKIGFTRRPLEQRLRHLSVGVPEPLVIYATHPGTMADERDHHRRFAGLRLQGEWFRRARPLSTYIASLTKRGSAGPT